MANNLSKRIVGLVLALLAGGVALVAQAPAHGAPGRPALPPPQWGSDRQVNPTPSATPTFHRNPTLALDPTDPFHLIAGYEIIHQWHTDDGTAYSTDGGATWAGQPLVGTWIPNSDVQPAGAGVVGFDRQGTAYFAGLGVGGQLSGLFVLTSTLGAAWNTPVPVVVTDYTQYRDQPQLAVDTRPSGPKAGSLYLAYRLFLSNFDGLWLRYSRDSGRTWGREVPVSDPGHEIVNGISSSVAQDGTLYVAFGANDGPYPTSNTQFYLDRSTDAGLTWGTDLPITGVVSKTGALDWKGHTYVLPGSADMSQQAFLLATVPLMAVDPAQSNRVYVVWNDGRWDKSYHYQEHDGQHGDIAFARSTDSGLTWAGPTRLNDDPLGNGVDQFLPNIAVGPDGGIGVTWYDRRDDPAHILYYIYYTQSTDGGVTWSANQRVSDVPSDPMANPNPKGEGIVDNYRTLLYGPDFVLACWTDSRAGHAQDIYADRGQLPTLTPSPSPTASPTATPPATATATPPACLIQFTDVLPDNPFYTYIRCLACRGIIGGYSSSPPCLTGAPCFLWGNYVSRSQMSKFVSNTAGYADPIPSTQQTFADVPPSNPFWLYVERATLHDVISGYACDGATVNPCTGLVEACPGRYFRPCAGVTRGQTAKFISNAFVPACLLPPR